MELLLAYISLALNLALFLATKQHPFRFDEGSHLPIPCKNDEDRVYQLLFSDPGDNTESCLSEMLDLVQSSEGPEEKFKWIVCVLGLAIEHEAAFKSHRDGCTGNGNCNQGGDDNGKSNKGGGDDNVCQEFGVAIVHAIAKRYQESVACCKYFWCKPLPAFARTKWWKWIIRLPHLGSVYLVLNHLLNLYTNKRNDKVGRKHMRGWSHAVDGELEIVSPHAGDDACDASVLVYS